MKHITLILLSVFWLGLGCGTVKSWFGADSKPHEELPVPPDPSEVKHDENGNPIFTEEQLGFNKKPFNWTGALLAAGLFSTTALVVRHIVKNKK